MQFLLRGMILTLALAASACTSSELIAIGIVPEGDPMCSVRGVPIPGMVVGGTCRGAIMLGLGYASTDVPVRCVTKVKGVNVGVLLVECHPLPIGVTPK